MKNTKLLFVLFIIFSLTACENKSLKVDFIPVESGNKWGYVNIDGEYVINPQFSKATCFQDGIAKVKSLGKNPKYGFVNEEGKYVINPMYTSATVFSEGLACVTTENSAPFYIDKEGNTLFELKNSRSAYVFSEGYAIFSEYIYNTEKKSELLFGFIDKTGDKKIPAQFNDVESFSCGFAAIKNSDNLWGFINTDGKIVINYQFEKAELFSEDIAVVYNGDKWGAINTEGKYIINPQFDKLSKFNEGKAIFVKDNKRGFINTNGEIIINAQFDKARLFNHGFACVKTNGLWGYINKDGSYVINPQFKEASSFYGKIAIVKSGDKYGIIDDDGSFIANPQFNDVYSIVIDYPTFDNIGLISYNDLYVKTNFFDVEKVTNSVIRDVSNEAINEIYENSTVNEVLTYLNSIASKKLNTSSYSSYDSDISINKVVISKEIYYSVKIEFKNKLMIRKKDSRGYTNYSAGYEVNKKNNVESIIYKIYLSGEARFKEQQILDAFETKLSILKKSDQSNKKRIYLNGENYKCEIKLYSDQIKLIFDFDLNVRSSNEIEDDYDSEYNNPSDVAREFLIALAEQDYDRAKDFGTEETVQLISLIEGLAAMIPEEEADADKENIKTLKMGEVVIDGDNSVVYYGTDKKSDEKIDLQKVSGRWKVAMKKEM